MSPITDTKLEKLASITHATNKAYCETIGDNSQPNWSDEIEDKKASAIDGVRALVTNPALTCEELHENWMKFKAAQGYIYGKTKDDEAKTHPCMVPYSDLDVHKKFKDTLFHAVVTAYLKQREQV